MLQQYVNCEFPDFQAGFQKGRDRDQIGNILIEKAREFQKTSTCALLTMLKPLTVWITTNCGKFFKRWEYQTTWPASWEICMQVRKQQLDWTWNNRLVPNWERSTSRLYIVTLLISLICRVHNEKCWARGSTIWNQDSWEKYQEPQICRWYHPYGRKWKN